MKEELVVTEICPVHEHPSICWSAIFAGAFVGLGLAFLLHLYTVAIGLSAYSATDAASTIAIGGLVGMLIGVIVAMGIAGFVSGYLGRTHYHQCSTGIIYGFLTWSVIIALSAIFAGPMAHFATTTLATPDAVVSNAPTVNVTNNTTAPVEKTAPTSANPAIDVTPKALAYAGWVVFVMFFIGALSACIGACCGMMCCKHHDEVTSINKL